MEPNFETLECVMRFGVPPPADPRDDPVYNQPCVTAQCAMAAPAPAACPKIDTDRTQGGA